jgi:galactonate dehydratase
VTGARVARDPKRLERLWRDRPSFAPQAGQAGSGQAGAAAASTPLTIANIRAWRVKEPAGGRRYTVVKVETRGGAAGYGEGAAIEGIAFTRAKPLIVGRRAVEQEYFRHALAATPALEAAVSNACLDAVARHAKVPLYQFLGGPTRFKARVLASPEGLEPAAFKAPLERALKAGFRAVTIPIPRHDTLWRMQAYVDAVRARVKEARAMTGEGIEIVLDAAGTLTPGDAAFVAKALEPDHIMWLDEPTTVLTNDALAKIADESVMPIALGRGVTDIAAFQNLLRHGSLDLLRPSLGLNSLHKIRRMAAIAETHYVAVAGYHDGGPINSLAGIHFNAALANSFIQQVPFPAAERDAAMRAEITGGPREVAVDGFAALINEPGLGVAISDAALAKYSEEAL